MDWNRRDRLERIGRNLTAAACIIFSLYAACRFLPQHAESYGVSSWLVPAAVVACAALGAVLGSLLWGVLLFAWHVGGEAAVLAAGTVCDLAGDGRKSFRRKALFCWRLAAGGRELAWIYRFEKGLGYDRRSSSSHLAAFLSAVNYRKAYREKRRERLCGLAQEFASGLAALFFLQAGPRQDREKPGRHAKSNPY